MTLRLRCVRCGDLADLDPCDKLPGLCEGCILRWAGLFHRGWSWGRRWCDLLRHRRNWERHPTFIALSAALDAMESAEPGTLAEDA